MKRVVFKDLDIFDGSRFFKGSVTVSGDMIEKMMEGEYKDDAGAEDEVITGNYILMPGMINLHTHVPMSLFKGVSEDLPLEKWLHERIFPLESKFISSEMVYICGLWGMVELLRSGVTTFCDMYFFEEHLAKGASEINIKAFIGEGVINFPSPAGRTPEQTIEYTEHLAKKYFKDPFINVAAAPHSPYLTEEKYLLALKEISDKYFIPFHIHMAESALEVKNYKEQAGVYEFERFEQLGLLSEKFIGAHCVNLNYEELAIMAKNKVTVAHCPSSNMKLGNGIARVSEMIEMGINVAVATDGSASNNNLNVIQEAELAAKLQKVAKKDPTVFRSLDALKAVTSNAGKPLGRGFGVIEEGVKADLVLIKTDTPEMYPVYDPAASILYSSSFSDIESVFVNGKKVVHQGKIETIDINYVKKEIVKIARLVERSI